MKQMLSLLSIIFVAITGTVGSAQEAPEKETQWSYGNVRSVAKDQFTVSEYDYDREEDIESTYKVTQETKFENLKSLQDLVVGDDVDIEYTVRSGERAALVVSRENGYVAEEV